LKVVINAMISAPCSVFQNAPANVIAVCVDY